MAMNYDTAFRPYLAKRIEKIEAADLVVGIPCYNNETTIAHVLKQVSRGLAEHFKSARAVILISDGGSTDDTGEIVRGEEIEPWQEKVVFIYRGISGKGTALRAIFEAVGKLNAKACAVVDADLRSITPEWVKLLLEPILEKNYHFVAPVYARHKYDGTITNQVVYSLTRALYGKRIRQPIGGDFGFSRDLASFYHEQNIWTTDVARFGIDIWMTTQAISQGFRICQSTLGVKVHDPKDPAASLGPMFRQVVHTLFTLIEQNSEHWKAIEGSKPVETFGTVELGEPEPVEISLDSLLYLYKQGFQHFGVLWKELLSGPSYEALASLAEADVQNFRMSPQCWARILYELAATFHHWPRNRGKLIEVMSPLYYGRVASFVGEAATLKSQEAEQLIEAKADVIEKEKSYLLQAWTRESSEPEEKSLLSKLLPGLRG